MKAVSCALLGALACVGLSPRPVSGPVRLTALYARSIALRPGLYTIARFPEEPEADLADQDGMGRPGLPYVVRSALTISNRGIGSEVPLLPRGSREILSSAPPGADGQPGLGDMLSGRHTGVALVPLVSSRDR